MSPDSRKHTQAGPSTSHGDVANGSHPDKKKSRTSEDVNTSKVFLKKRKRDSSPPVESNSFVSTVKTKMTNLLQASFSKWFSSPSSSKSNGSVPMIDITDSSTDDDREPETPIVINSPPAKRKKYSGYLKVDGNCLVQRNRGDTSVPFRNKSSQSSDEEIVERSEQRHPPKRQFPFHCDDRPAKRSSSQNSMIDLKQPSFKQSLIGSVFYPGRTSYGGATSQYINQPNIAERKDTHVTEVNSCDSMNMSHASRRVMELLDQYTSPRRDALRIPNYDRTPCRDSSSANSSVLSSNKTQELHVPSILSLLRLKQRSRLMDTTNTARQIIASQSSTSDFNTTLDKTTNQPTSFQSGHSQLHLSDVTPPSPARLVEDVNSIIETECVPSMPPAKRDTLSSNGNKDYKFSTPTKVSPGAPVNVCMSPIYTFGGPESDIDVNKRNEETIAPVKDFEKGKNKPKDWQCPDCWVFNNTTKCSCCGAQKPVNAYDKNAKCKICKQSYRQPHSDKCITCERIPTSISFYGHTSTGNYAITNPLPINRDKSKWTCIDCLVANEASAEKCVCCGAKSTLSPQKKTAADLQNEWTCSHCSIKNKVSVDKCPGCGGITLAGKQNKPVLSTKRNFIPTSAADSKVQNIVNKQNEKWECGSCLVRNDSDKMKCVCCDTERTDGDKQIKNTFNFGTSTVSSVDSNIENIVNKQNQKWECDSCMVRNDSDKMKCVCCDTDRPQAGKQIKNTFNFGINTSTVDSKVQTIVNKQNEKWECASCLVRNDSNKIKCICCETERSGTDTPMKSTFNFGLSTTSKFKFGIEPKEQENNLKKSEIEKKDEQESETNNNILPKAVTFGLSGKASGDQTDSSTTDNKNDSAPKVAFSFGIPKQLSSVKPDEKSVDCTKEKPKDLPKVGLTTLETKPVENSLSGMFSLTSQANTEKPSTLPTPLLPTLPATLPLTQPVSVPTSLPATIPAALPAAPPPALPTSLPPSQPVVQPNIITVKTPEVLGTNPQKKSFSFSESGTGLTNLFAKPDEPSPAPLSLFSRNEQTTTSNFFQKPVTTTTVSVTTVPAANPVFTFDANAKPIGPSVQTEPKLSFNFGNTNKSDSSNSFTFKFGSTADNPGSKSFNLPSAPSVGANNLLSGNVLSAGNGLPSGNGLPEANLASVTEQSQNPLRTHNELGSSNIFGAPVQKDNVWSFNTSTTNLFGTNNNASNVSKPVFSFGSTSTPFNNSSTPVFGGSVQPTQNMFGIANQSTPTPQQQSLFSSPAQSQPASNIFGSPQQASGPEAQLGIFGNCNVSSGSTFGPTQSTPSFEAAPVAQPPGAAFNFGASQSVGVFGFGQPQQSQQQPYKFGAAAAGSPQVQFNMGNVATAGARRVRKAVRRNQR